MSQNSAPESVGSTAIVDAPTGREIPLTEFTDPGYETQPHYKAYSFLQSSLLDTNLDDPDRPERGEKESARKYEERLLEGIRTALQPDIDDSISAEGLWARNRLLAMGEDAPDTKDLAAAVDARREITQQEPKWKAHRKAMRKRFDQERYVAEHVFADASGLASVSGMLDELTHRGESGIEIAKESVLLDRIAHEIAVNALAGIPDESLVKLEGLRGTKGIREARTMLTGIAQDLALQRKDITYESLRTELTSRIEEKVPLTPEEQQKVDAGQFVERKYVLTPRSQESRDLAITRSMLDAQFYTTMREAIRRVPGMRGVDDLAAAPSEVFGDASPSVIRAVAELKKIPRSPEGIRQLMESQGILERATSHMRIIPRQDGESDEAYEARRSANSERLMKKLALNFTDYAFKGTDWMMRMKSPKNLISAVDAPQPVRVKAFEQSAGSSPSSTSSRERTPKAARTVAVSRTEPTITATTSGAGGEQDPAADDGSAVRTDNETSTDDHEDGDDEHDETEDDPTNKNSEFPPVAPGEDDSEDDNGDDDETDDDPAKKRRELHTSARLAIVALKDAGMENVDNIARFTQNRPDQLSMTGKNLRDRMLGITYKIPLFGGLFHAAAHPVKDVWHGMVIKGNIDSTNLRFAGRLRNVAKDISSTDHSVPFELTEDVVAQALAGAKDMKAKEGFFRRIGRMGRNIAHAATGLVRSSEMVRAEEWLKANGQALLTEQKAAMLREQTALAERFTLEGSDDDVLAKDLGESRLHLSAETGDYSAVSETANRDLKALIEQYASGAITDENAFLKKVNEYVHGTLADSLSEDDRKLLASSEFASNILPIANEMKAHWTEYITPAEDGSDSAFAAFKLDITIGTGKWGGARSVEKSGKLGFSLREKLARRLAEHPQGFGSRAYAEAYGITRNIPRLAAFGGMYAGMFGAGLLPFPASALARATSALGIVGLSAAREGMWVGSHNGRLFGLGGKTQEKYAQTSYEIARGRKSSPDGVLMKQMEALMVHRVGADTLAEAITKLSAKPDLSAAEAEQLLAAVAHAKARISLTDRSVTRQKGVKRAFDLALPNNFIEFNEGAENRQYMALRKAILDGQVNLARTAHATHLDDAVLVMQGQLAKGNDKAGIEKWLVSTQGKTPAEARQMVADRFSDLGIKEGQAMNKRMAALARYSWRKGASAGIRSAIYGGAMAGAGVVMHEAAQGVGSAVEGIASEAQHVGEVGIEAYSADWGDLLDGHVEPSDVLHMDTGSDGNPVVVSNLTTTQNGALMANHIVREIHRNTLAGLDYLTPGDTFDTEVQMAEPTDIGGVQVALPENVHHFIYNDPVPSDGPHDVIFDARNGQVYDLTASGVTLGLDDLDADGKLDLVADAGSDSPFDATELTKPGESLEGFSIVTREGDPSAVDYQVGPSAEVTFEHPQLGKLKTEIPDNTQWVVDQQGVVNLVVKDNPNVVLLGDVEFNDEGGIVSDKNGLLDESNWENKVLRVQQPSAPTLNPDGSINGASQWAENTTEIPHSRYFSENGSQLGIHTIKDGNSLILSMQEAANRSDHIANAIASGQDHGFYLSLGGHPDHGIYIPDPDNDGLAIINADDTTPMEITHLDGSKAISSGAELHSLIVNKEYWDGLDDGNFASELYKENREVFALNGGRLEAVIIDHDANGELVREIIGTGKGTGAVSEGIMTVQQTEVPIIHATSQTSRVFEVTPPFFEPDGEPGIEGNPASDGIQLFYAPIPTFLEKERSVTGENVGKAGNVPENVSFAGGTVVTSPIAGTGDDEEEDDGSGTRKDETEDDSGTETETDPEKIQAKERINKLKEQFTTKSREAMTAAIASGTLTAEALAGTDFASLGLKNVTLEEAEQIIANPEKLNEFIERIWNQLLESHEKAFEGGLESEGKLKDLFAKAVDELKALEPAESGLTDNERRLLDVELLEKFSQALIGVETVPELDSKKALRDIVKNINPGATDEDADRALSLYYDFKRRLDAAKASSPDTDDAELKKSVVQQYTIGDLPTEMANVLRGFTQDDGHFSAEGEEALLTYVNRFIEVEDKVLEGRLQYMADQTGVEKDSVIELLTARRALIQKLGARVESSIFTSKEFIDGLEEKIRAVEVALNIPETADSDDDSSGGAGGEDTTETDESGAVVESAAAAKVRAEILRFAGERTPAMARGLIDRARTLIEQQSTAGEGKIKATIQEMAAETELFVDGKIAYIPRREGKLITVGDLHGDSKTVEQILTQSGFIENMVNGNKGMTMVFMGDYVDRGQYSIRVMEMILDLKVRFPNNVILMKADHEVAEGGVNPQNFPGQVRTKYGADGQDIFDRYVALFDTMPRTVVTANGIVIGHGGPVVSKDGKIPNLVQLRDGSTTLYKMMEWGDPSTSLGDGVLIQGNALRVGSRDAEDAYQRGLIVYSPEALRKYLARIGGRVFVRAHEESHNKAFSDSSSPFHGMLMQVHSTGDGSSESEYISNLATYGEFDLNTDIDRINYAKNQRLVWPTTPSA